jgi:hypothetical protein
MVQKRIHDNYVIHTNSPASVCYYASILLSAHSRNARHVIYNHATLEQQQEFSTKIFVSMAFLQLV